MWTHWISQRLRQNIRFVETEEKVREWLNTATC